MNNPGIHPEWQERTLQMFGEVKLSRLQHSNVLIAGMVGVGSMAEEMI